jgi:uncharacterized C2H2 Zn-finger protein
MEEPKGRRCPVCEKFIEMKDLRKTHSNKYHKWCYENG